MAAIGFHRWLRSRNQDFGLDAAAVERILGAADRGRLPGTILDSEPALRSQLVPRHLLPLLREAREYRLFSQQAAALNVRVASWRELEAWRWVERSRTDAGNRPELVAWFCECATTVTRRGRLRWQLLAEGWPEGLGATFGSSHSEGLDLPAHRYLAARRAEAQGAIHIEVVLPEGLFSGEVADRLDEVEKAGLRKAIETCLLRELQRRSQRQVIAGAADTLLGMLMVPPVAKPVAGVIHDGRTLFAAICGGDHDGARAEFSARDAAGLAGWLERRQPLQVVVSRAGSQRDLTSLLKRLTRQGLDCRPWHQAGLMRQARRRGGPLGLEAARVVAERVRDALAATADCEPGELGLGEYLDQVDERLLAAALADARNLAEWYRKHGDSVEVGGRVGASFNPMIKGLADLRPGLELMGTVANITHFGAFVDVGLETEGLVHLSELADHFVKHPSEVVRVGQQVRVRVLEIDSAAGRLSLSMRSGGARRRRSNPDKQAQARERLESLFKKG